MDTDPSVDTFNRWPNRVALWMTLITFPLIWAGGLVTTYDAGMAVPDWPGTYGYNMFLYPLSTWASGPWDLFIEHGHRLLGSLAGMLAILFVFVVLFKDPRRWLKLAAVGALLLVILQGTLGGVRVLAADREIAKIHGCIGPAFFAYCIALCVFTSRRWRQARPEKVIASLAGLRRAGVIKRLGLMLLGLSYLQLVLGANLRHIAVDADPMTYRSLVILHLVVAGLVLVHALALLWQMRYSLVRELGLRGPALTLSVLVVIQICLGLATWIVKFGWPSGLNQRWYSAGFVPHAKSIFQTTTITAHVAVGSLILAFATLFVIRALRGFPRPAQTAELANVLKGATA